MPEPTSKLNLTVPVSIQIKLREIADTLGINKTSALVMAINEYHERKVKPDPHPPRP